MNISQVVVTQNYGHTNNKCFIVPSKPQFGPSMGVFLSVFLIREKQGDEFGSLFSKMSYSHEVHGDFPYLRLDLDPL